VHRVLALTVSTVKKYEVTFSQIGEAVSALRLSFTRCLQTALGSKRRARVAAVLAVAACTAALIGPPVASADSVSSPPCNGTADPLRNVAAVGDSITMQLTDLLHWDFAANGDPISVQGHCGYTIKQLRNFVRLDSAGVPHLRQLFFFAGTNDAWGFYNDSGWALQKDSLNELDGAVHDLIDKHKRACMFLVTVPHIASLPRYDLAATAIDNKIRSLDQGSSRVFTIDWATASQGHPEYFKDFIGHLTPQGAQQLANLYLWYHNGWGSGCRG